jgi:hypothetical protein
MDLTPQTSTEIALNVTRTRVTVVMFNMTIIALMISLLGSRSASANFVALAHLTSSLALFIGFCLSLLGLWWLIFSQNNDAEGLSRAWPFTLGSVTTYLAGSQTATAFMHEYLVGIELAAETRLPVVAQGPQFLVPPSALGDTALLILLILAGIVWILITYAGPLAVVLKSPVRGGRRWVFAAYYFALQVPICWVYAKAYHLEYVSADQSADMLGLFALQFFQPMLWYH